MSIRFYLMPILEKFDPTGIVLQARGPKYIWWGLRSPNPSTGLVIDHTDVAGVDDWNECLPYGLQLVCLEAVNLSAAQHVSLASQPDVTQIPANLDNNVGAANLATVKATIEGLGIPADQITAATTYRQILRGLTAIFAIAQNLEDQAGGRLLPNGITLDTALGDLPQGVLGKLQEACAKLNYVVAGLTLTDTIRDFLRTLANQQSPQAMLGVQL